MVTSTRTMEEHLRDAPLRVRLLVRVLDYDDLLRDDATAHVLPPGEGGPLLIARADREHQAGLSRGASGSELRLQDRWLSGAHATVVSREDEDVLCDQRSRNGTYVNGKRITEHILEDGDLIETGHTLLCYRVVDERLAAATLRGAQLGPTRTLCPEVAAMVQDLDRIAGSEQSVLILAETGCGKEVTAAMLHQRSARKGAYYTVDCGAVPESLFESVFFGHRRGAFTGATGDQIGVIQRAHGGTLFLDEVANLTLAAQAKLLRVVEDGRLVPLGAGQPQQVDVRWVAATNANLLAAGSSFRQDLLRRLAGFVARLPPLRRRREDLGVLAAHILREAGAGRASISAAAGRRLFTGRFPGNIRQLRAVLRSAVLLAGEAPIEIEHLASPEGLSSRSPRAAVTGPGFSVSQSEVTDREARSAAVMDREARSAAVMDREARSAAVMDREARSAAVMDREARSAAVMDREARSGAVLDRDARGGAVMDVGGAGSAPEPPSAATAVPASDQGRRGQPSGDEIESALQLTKGNMIRAARYLNTHPRQLYRWVERLGLDLSRYRE